MNGAASLAETEAIGQSRFTENVSKIHQRDAVVLGCAYPASATYEPASRSMKPPIDNVIDRAAITIASRIQGALRLYSPFIWVSIGLSDQAAGSCAERQCKSVGKSSGVLKKVHV